MADGLHGLVGVLQGFTWSRAQLLDYQSRRLRSIVLHAYRRVPRYRRLFDEAGLKPADIRGLEDLSRIPISPRAAFQQASARDVVTEGVDPDALVIRKTSGSTGAPLVIRRSALEHYLLGILRVRDMLRCGMRFRHRRAVTSLMRSGDSRAQPMPADRLFGGMGLFRWVPLDCQDPVDQLIDQLRRIRPDAVMGFPGLVTDIAERLTESDRARIRPKLVVVGGETFTDDMRRRVREGFRANVYAAYTSHEFRNIAVDCPATGRYHVCDESVIVELLRDGWPVQVGEAGEVVVTGLHSYAMPFIRYPLGDLAVREPSPCGCGAPYAALEQVLGRVVDRFPLPDGRAILPYGLARRINSEMPWVLRFQVKQQRLDRFRVRLVANYDPSDEAIARLREIFTGHFGEDIQVAFEFVDALSLEATGKFRTYEPLPLPGAERTVTAGQVHA